MGNKVSLERLRDTLVLKRANKEYKAGLGLEITRDYLPMRERIEIFDMLEVGCLVTGEDSSFEYVNWISAEVSIFLNAISNFTNFDYDGEIRKIVEAEGYDELNEEEQRDALTDFGFEVYDLFKELKLLIDEPVIHQFVTECRNHLKDIERSYTSAGYQLSKLVDVFGDLESVDKFIETVDSIDSETIDKVAKIADVNNYDGAREKIEKQPYKNKGSKGNKERKPQNRK